MADSAGLFQFATAAGAGNDKKRVAAGDGVGPKRQMLRRCDHVAAQVFNPHAASGLDHASTEELWKRASQGNKKVQYFTELADETPERRGIGISRTAEVLKGEQVERGIDSASSDDEDHVDEDYPSSLEDLDQELAREAGEFAEDDLAYGSEYPSASSSATSDEESDAEGTSTTSGTQAGASGSELGQTEGPGDADALFA
ncbi:unnamed protein product [Prorocentrum cordatum]|uniref:Uncharacterized protein n=1 Tax=Prorocentrum cordatum TaxID=2364126 RepID=A0ABN9V964_9DINO|nr:unnamed protein product [Polarella glacialis]